MISKLIKLLGAAALVAGLTPYKVSKDEETGEVKAKALLWKASYTPSTEEKGKNVDVNFGLNMPGKDEDEAHIYTDDVTVSYTAEESEAPAEEAAEEKTEEAVEEKTEEAAEAPEAPEATEEAAAVEEPGKETKTEE